MKAKKSIHLGEPADGVLKFAWTIPQASFASNLSKSTLYANIKSGRLKPRKVGRSTFLIPDEVKALFDLPAPAKEEGDNG